MVLDGSVGDGCVVRLSYGVVTEECSVKDGDYREGRQLLPGLTCDAPIHFFRNTMKQRDCSSQKRKKANWVLLALLKSGWDKSESQPSVV